MVFIALGLLIVAAQGLNGGACLGACQQVGTFGQVGVHIFIAVSELVQQLGGLLEVVADIVLVFLLLLLHVLYLFF